MIHHWKYALLATLIAAAPAGAGPVNINNADADTLAKELKGIGASKAAAIVDYRQKHGPFRSVEELALVKGIGQKFIDQNRNDLKLNPLPAGKLAPPSPSATQPAAAKAR
jgi:competence protein ComEA